jgi:hypothetical protein
MTSKLFSIFLTSFLILGLFSAVSAKTRTTPLICHRAYVLFTERHSSPGRQNKVWDLREQMDFIARSFRTEMAQHV